MKLPGVVAFNRAACDPEPCQEDFRKPCKLKKALRATAQSPTGNGVRTTRKTVSISKLPTLLSYTRCDTVDDVGDDSDGGSSSSSSTSKGSDASAKSDGKATHIDDAAVADCRPGRGLVVPGGDLQNLADDPLSRKDFQAMYLLGFGGYSEVKLVRCARNGGYYALKAVEKATLREQCHLGDDKAAERIRVERDVSVAARDWACPFIVKLHATFQSTLKLYFVYEYCPGGELFALVRQQPNCRLEEAASRFYLAELVVALRHLHDNDVLHRDIKLENVLLDAMGHVRLADFGCARLQLPLGGTKSFVAVAEPEVFLPPELASAGETRSYGKEVDCWQMGVMAFAMTMGATPGRPPSVQDESEQDGHWLGQFPVAVSPEFNSFCCSLLQLDLCRRLGFPCGAGAMAGHPFLLPVDWDALIAKTIDPPFPGAGDGPDGGFVPMRESVVCKDDCSGKARVRGFSFSPVDGDPEIFPCAADAAP